MTVYLSVDDVVRIHDEVCAAPVRDHASLESAVNQTAQTWEGQDLYPSLIEKAAVHFRGVALAHGFAEGNKRAATLSTIVFLDVNGLILEAPATELADVAVAIVDEHLPLKKVTEWLAYHVRTAVEYEGGAWL